MTYACECCGVRTGEPHDWTKHPPYPKPTASAVQMKEGVPMKEDAILETARDLVTDWMNSEGKGPALSLIIATALRAARNEAIEEAAKVADDEEIPDPRKAPDHVGADQVALVIGVVQVTRESVARRIRALSSHPAGDEDG